MAAEQLEDCKRLRQEVLEAGYECGLLQAVLLRQGLTLDDIRALARDESPDDAVHTGKTELLSEETRLADLALARGSVTLDQYRTALQEHAARKIPLDEILVELGYLSQDVREALRKMVVVAPRPKALRRAEVKFGEQLVSLGFLTSGQLERGLKLHQAAPTGQRLGETLVLHDLLTQAQLDEALLRTAKVPTIQPSGYALEYRLGTGFTGSVFRGRKLGTQKSAALKIYYPSIAHQKGFEDRFNIEVSILKGMKVEGVPAILDAGILDAGRVPYVASELIFGVTLAGLVYARNHLEPAEAIKIVSDVARVLHHAGEYGISHRALSPRNVILSVDGRAHVTDWAVPLLMGKGEVGAGSGVPANTPARAFQFLSPEAILGEPCDERSDIYVLGTLLYYCVAGRPPFVSDSVSELFRMHLEQSPAAPPALGDLIGRMMGKEPSARFSSLRELEGALRSAYAGCVKPELMPFIPKKISSTRLPVKTRPIYYFALVLTLLASALYLYFRPAPQPKPVVDVPRPKLMSTVPLTEKHEPRVSLDLIVARKDLTVGEAFEVSVRLKNGSDQELSLTQIVDTIVLGGQKGAFCVMPEEFRSEARDLLWVKPGEEFEVTGLVSGSAILEPGRVQIGFDGLHFEAKVTVAAITVGPPTGEEAAHAFVTQYPDILRGWRLDRFTSEQYRVTSDFVSRFPRSRYAAEAWLTMARIYEVGISSYSSGKRVYTIRKDLDKSEACLMDIQNPALRIVAELMRAAHAEERGVRDARDELLAGLLKTYGNHLLFRYSRLCPQ